MIAGVHLANTKNVLKKKNNNNNSPLSSLYRVFNK